VAEAAARRPRTTRPVRVVEDPGPSSTGGRARRATKAGAPEDRSATVPSPGAHPGVTCTVGFCPVCLLVTAAGSASPELAEHLAAAGRELLLALRALIDARLEATGDSARPNGLERIPIE
jgi:hypothetical protein